ncbi:hypothetical protein SAMN02746062_01603 [Alysiella filiformis DSM 16848]|uniref:Uncharacterized protein n=1 Tax=Alysiella filiformis DSM 16848 TaxID=1120981 RepID=A0A286EEE6_9NEIS|nr:hypothetical protein SAMN02746062_01603 [Alysiella filiformis DSM 16848]
MPELPEVETTLRGKKIAQTLVRQAKSRWQMPPDLVSKASRLNYKPNTISFIFNG